jgi:hypothetical protein
MYQVLYGTTYYVLEDEDIFQKSASVVPILRQFRGVACTTEADFWLTPKQKKFFFP